MRFPWWPWKRKAPTDDRASTGLWGEDQAARMLKAKGYRILGSRVRIGRRDELDIVARHGEVLVFVEVKTRNTEDFGRPISSVDRAKRKALSRAALGYLRRLRQKPPYFRFDVVEVVVADPSRDPVIRHIENAFTLNPRYRIPW
jgi:putative endonuclease